METKKFWMVHIANRSSPAKQHYSYEEAKKEAERLASETKQATYILCAIAKFQVKPCECTQTFLE